MGNRLILVTGTRHELPIEIATLVKDIIVDDIEKANPKEVIFLHGGCPTGVDALVAKHFHPCWTFPANWDKLNKSAGPVRNQAMVDVAVLFQRYGHDVICYAFPALDSRGTVDCVARAERAGIMIVETELSLAKNRKGVVDSSLWSKPRR